MNKLINLFDKWFGSKPEPVPVPKPKPIDRRPLYRELYTQCVNNARYIRASINTCNGIVNFVKGESPAETRTKRQNLQSHIEWLKKKLVEEEGLVEYYGKLKD